MKIFAGWNKIFFALTGNWQFDQTKNHYYTQFQPRKNPSNPSAPCASYWLSVLSGWRVWFFNPSALFSRSGRYFAPQKPSREGVGTGFEKPSEKPPHTEPLWKVWKSNPSATFTLIFKGFKHAAERLKLFSRVVLPYIYAREANFQPLFARKS